MAEYHDADDSDHSSSTIACACGQTAHYAGRRPKTFTTLLGPLTLHRSCSPRWTRRSRPTWTRSSDEETRMPAPGAASTMYLGLDGTGVPVRKSEVEGRRGKQPDGSAKTRRGQARHRVDGGNTQRRRPPRTRPRVGQLQRRGRERGQPPHRPAAFPVRATGGERGGAASTTRRHRRRGRVDLESARTVPRRHRNRRHLPRQGASAPSTAPARRSGGARTGGTSWTPGGSMRSLRTARPARRPASVSTT